MIMHCPSCGADSSVFNTDLFPGEVERTCPCCKTKWTVYIQFIELPSDDNGEPGGKANDL